MATNERLIDATTDEVWDVLGDGWLYPLWVVGASRMRQVDDHWPERGAQLHHSVGAWPLLVDDRTEVLEVIPGSLLRLKARAWPSGAASVTIRLEAVGQRTRVVMEEDVQSGPGRLVPGPARQPPLTWRNVESLRRLRYVVEGRRGAVNPTRG